MKPALLTFLASLALATFACAAPRLDTQSVADRHDLLLLRDSGAIASPVLSWPWPMGRQGPGEDRASPFADASRRMAQRYASASQLGFQPLAISLVGASERQPFRSFGFQPRESFESTVSQAWLSEWFAGNLSLTYADAEQDEFRLDGSSLSIALGNWAAAIDQVDRWWGPGWDGSLILSNNARPIPALSLTRIAPEPFEHKWLRWIGPWTLHTFMGQLSNDEGERPGSDARLFGLRIEFKPFGWDNLDIGLSRVAQWAGDGRPGNFNTFWRLLRGIDNEGGDKEPGNQLAGVDYRLRLPGWNLAHYGQVTGEDEDGFLPDANMLLFGLESWGELPALDATWRAYFEWADTRAGYLRRDPTPSRDFNTAYNHGIYRTGYREKGASMGHAMDGDSVMRSLGAFLTQDNGNLWGFKVRNYALNRDGRGPNSVTIETVEGRSLEFFAELSQIPFLDSPSASNRGARPRPSLRLGLHHIDEETVSSGETSDDFGGYLGLVFHY